MANLLSSSSLRIVPPEHHPPSAQATNRHPRFLPPSRSHLYSATKSCPLYVIPYSWNGLFLSMSTVLSSHPNHWNSLFMGFPVYTFITLQSVFHTKVRKCQSHQVLCSEFFTGSPLPSSQTYTTQWVCPRPPYLKVVPLHLGIPPLPFLPYFFLWHLSSSDILHILLVCLLPIFLFQMETTQG